MKDNGIHSWVELLWENDVSKKVWLVLSFLIVSSANVSFVFLFVGLHISDLISQRSKSSSNTVSCAMQVTDALFPNNFIKFYHWHKDFFLQKLVCNIFILILPIFPILQYQTFVEVVCVSFISTAIR